MKIYVFCHATDHPTSERVMGEQLLLMIDCGLMKKAERVFVHLHGTNFNVHKTLFSLARTYKNLRPKKGMPTDQYYEFPTMIKLKEYCDQLEDDAYICYIHNKGVYSKDHHGRRRAQYWILTEWNRCVAAMRKDPTIDVVAVGRELDPHTGKQWTLSNYWWSRASFIKKLAPLTLPPPSADRDTKMLCEKWLGTLPHKQCDITLGYKYPEHPLLKKNAQQTNKIL